MSWNKNTIDNSQINSIARILLLLEIPYTIEVLASIKGSGLNDFDLVGEDEVCRTYELRELRCAKFVVLDSIYKTLDCDADDIISSDIFKIGEEPKEWNPIIKEASEDE